MASPEVTASKCYLLDLPVELRNRVYGLAFQEPATELNLFAAHPPSKALLLTCHQIRSEATGIHRGAYRRYWRSAKFFLPVSECVASRSAWRRTYAAARALRKDLAYTAYLRISEGSDAYIFHDGIWTFWEMDAAGIAIHAQDRDLRVKKIGVVQRHEAHQAGFRRGVTIYSARFGVWSTFVLIDESWARIAEAKQLFRRSGLTPEEVMIALRHGDAGTFDDSDDSDNGDYEEDSVESGNEDDE